LFGHSFVGTQMAVGLSEIFGGLCKEQSVSTTPPRATRWVAFSFALKFVILRIDNNGVKPSFWMLVKALNHALCLGSGQALN